MACKNSPLARGLPRSESIAPGRRFARAEARRGHLADRRCVLCHQALRSFCTADHLVKQDQQDSVRGSSMFFTRKKSSAELPK
jgi:hypothetical protein